MNDQKGIKHDGKQYQKLVRCSPMQNGLFSYNTLLCFIPFIQQLTFLFINK